MKTSLRLAGVILMLFLLSQLQSIEVLDVQLHARLAGQRTGLLSFSLNGDEPHLELGFSSTKPVTMDHLQNLLKTQVDKHQTPSVQYLFFNSDSILYTYRYGVKQVGTYVPIDEATTYHLYSVTKTFTALAVLQLAQSGRLALEEPVITYLPAFPYAPEITIEQLLSHTAGLPNPMPLRWVHPAAEHATFDRDAFFQDIFQKHAKQIAAPGSKFRYSNLGYVLLGQVIERVSGQTFEDFINQYILEPAGIKRDQLGFSLPASHHATGYHKYWSFSNALLSWLIDKQRFMGPREGKWQAFQPFYNNGIAYGGMFGTGKALAQYGQALLKPGSGLLNEQYRALLFQEKTVQGKATGMSFSWFTGSLHGQRYVAHAGGGGGYYVELRLYPDLGVGSTLLYNRSGMTDQRLLDHTDRAFLPV